MEYNFTRFITVSKSILYVTAQNLISHKGGVTMNKSIKKVLLVCSLLFLSNPIPINAENDTELIFDSKQGTFQEFLNAQTGDVKVTLNSGISGAEISIPENITSLEIDLNGYRIYSRVYANGIPLTISNGEVGVIYGGSNNIDINANPYINLSNIRLRGNLYGGGYSDSSEVSANVNGDVTIILDNVRVTDELENPYGMGDAYEVYGGGYATKGGEANVNSSEIIVTESFTSSIFGGGYANSGTANVLNQTSLTIDSSTSYGDMVGCGVLKGDNSSATCGSTNVNILNMYFPAAWSDFREEMQSGYIIGGSCGSKKENLIGMVYGNVSLTIQNTKIYGDIVAGGNSEGGSFSVGSIDLLIEGLKEFYEPRLESTELNCTISNQVLCLGGGSGDSFVEGNVNAVIRNSDLNSIIVTDVGEIRGDLSLEFSDYSRISDISGIDNIILDAPLTIEDFPSNKSPINVELKGKWENDVKAITLDKIVENHNLFTGTNLVYGEDTVSYWITNGIEDIPEPQPEPDPKPDHSSSSNNSSSSTIIKGDTETSVKVDNINSTLNEKTVKKLAEDNQNVPVIVESKDVKITYPTGTLTNMDKAISVKVDIDGKAAVTKKATEAAGDSKSMTLNFTEESMFAESQPIKIEVKAKPELKGKQLYYKKYDEATNQLLLVQPTVVKEDGWLEVSQTEAGCYVVTESIDPYWQKSITGDWYYFNTQGSVVTGWLADKDEWYYLKEDGKMQVGWISADNTWYCTNNDGKLITGWNPQGSDWYYHNGSGSLVKNEWVWDAGWYYINDEGKMLRDSYTPDGYHVNSSGVYDY